MRLDYHILDVFTHEAFAGNPLAIVLDADGLSTARMQAVAREFNLSETVFVFAPRDPVNSARLRIFSPTRELPFAGHPTIGAAVLLGLLRAGEYLAREDVGIVLEEPIGPVRCTVRRLKGHARASFTLPQLPASAGPDPDPQALAAALGVAPADIGFDDHAPTLFSAGVGFTFVPLADRAAVTRAAPDLAHWDAIGPADHPAAFVYTRDVARRGGAFHARMFAPSMGIAEDPATGSAVAALAGALMRFEGLADGDHTFIIEQGFAMGRPSLITLGLDVAGGVLTAASIGGAAVMAAQGVIEA